MDQFFADLGRTVFARWKAENFSLPAFPEIARRALEERPPSEHVDLSELVHDFLRDDAQPFQTQSGFGQPEIVVYDDPRFYIQLLFWLDGTTDIHQHEFSGAFHVLAGSSIHSLFAFEKAQSVTPHLRVGRLRMTKTELLETGRTLPIVSGRDYIHSLFHLDTPSVTVVVRTQTDVGTGPQFTYLPPHIAVDPVHADALTMRRKQLIDVMEKTEDPAYAGLVIEMLADLDFERGFFVLQNVANCLQSLGDWEDAWKVFRKKHGKLADYVAPTLTEIARRDGISAMRSSITEVEHRFFLALLLNVPNRDDILGMVAQRFPGKPIETILRWAAELAEISDEGAWLLDAQFPPELDVDLDEQPAMLLSALRVSLGGGKVAGLSAARLKALRAALVRSSWSALISPKV
ncbi:MAG: hypothetical protein ABMA13_13760 [Chthoniobacteraceae bacterium]